MIKKIIGYIWKNTPPFVRVRAIRATQTKFTVSVAAVIVNGENKVLLLDHVLRPFSSWGLPGGFIEKSEQLEDALRRELHEEIGIELKNIEMYQVRTIFRHVEVIFSAETDQQPQIKSREINRAEWFTVDEMPEKMSNGQKILIRQVLRRRRS